MTELSNKGKVVAESAVGDKGPEVKTCNYKQIGADNVATCALTNRKCTYARCPQNPRKDISIETPEKDGRITRRTLHPDGSISTHRFDNAEIRKLFDNVMARFDSEAYWKDYIGGRCRECGKVLDCVDARYAQNPHCLSCHQEFLERNMPNVSLNEKKEVESVKK
jgi:hypothetical protein